MIQDSIKPILTIMAIVFKLEPTKWEEIFANNGSNKG